MDGAAHLFISYRHKDAEAVDALALDVARRRPGDRGFLERLERPDRNALALAAELAHELPSGPTGPIRATTLTRSQKRWPTRRFASVSTIIPARRMIFPAA